MKKITHFDLFVCVYVSLQNACGNKIGIARALLNRPDVVSIGVVWVSKYSTLRFGRLLCGVNDWQHVNEILRFYRILSGQPPIKYMLYSNPLEHHLEYAMYFIMWLTCDGHKASNMN